MSNEVKVALLAIVAVALAYWGYRFIEGKNILSNSNIYYAKYNSIEGLQKSVSVRIRGYEVGFVSDIRVSDDYQSIIVTLDIKPDVKISKQTEAAITSDGIMGGKYVELLNYNCTDGTCAESGDFLQGKMRSLLNSMVGKKEFEEYFSVVNEGLKTLIDSLGNTITDEDNSIGRSVKSMEATLQNLESSSAQLDRLMRRSSGDIEGSLKNLNTLSTTLAESNDTIKSILANAEKMTADLSSGELKATLQEALAAVKALQGTLSKADGMILSFTEVADKINSGDGTLGKLLEDEALYNQLIMTTESLDTLLGTLNEKPYRFVPFKGRKRVLRYDRKDAQLEEEQNN